MSIVFRGITIRRCLMNRRLGLKLGPLVIRRIPCGNRYRRIGYRNRRPCRSAGLSVMLLGLLMLVGWRRSLRRLTRNPCSGSMVRRVILRSLIPLWPMGRVRLLVGVMFGVNCRWVRRLLSTRFGLLFIGWRIFGRPSCKWLTVRLTSRLLRRYGRIRRALFGMIVCRLMRRLVAMLESLWFIRRMLRLANRICGLSMGSVIMIRNRYTRIL